MNYRYLKYFADYSIKYGNIFSDEMNNRGYDPTKLKSIVLIDECFDSQLMLRMLF